MRRCPWLNLNAAIRNGLCAVIFAALPLRAEPPPEQPAADIRLGELKTLDGYFPFTPPTDHAAWDQRAEQVRTRIRVAEGIWPEPTRTPLNAVIHGRIDGDDYTVEKVSFESMPGLFVTGNLYRPKGEPAQKRPAILCPHGHWDEARFHLLGDAEIKKEIESGGERLANGGRSMFQALGVQLARMGCVAFVFDMLGYCDSQQFSHALVHKFAVQRPEMNTRENWGLFSPQAEAHAQSVMGLQTWNSVRALDFLAALPDVDPARLGCTGASGGGTQTMLLGAIDSRLAVECPAVMVSTAMQGGCTCENASLLRVGTGNVEFAALFAPKPLGMTAANDWTKEMPSKGFPELQKHFAFMGAPEHVALWPFLQFPHNYNAVSRGKSYEWFNQHFALGLPAEKLVEREYTLLQKEQLTVWDTAHPAPAGGPDFERKLLAWWDADAHRQLTRSPEDFRKIAAPAWDVILGRTLADVGAVAFDLESKTERGDVWELSGTIRNTTHHEAFAARFLHPKKWNGKTVIWLDERGKSGLFENDAIRPEVRLLLESGASVIGLDLLSQADSLTQTRRVKNPRESAAYTFGYNSALFAQRVHDVLTAIQFVRTNDHQPRSIALAALDSTGPLAAAVRALAGPALSRVALSLTTKSRRHEEEVTAATKSRDDGEIHRAFRFASLLDLRDPNFLPAAAKYGDIAGLLALGVHAPARVLGGEANLAEEVRAISSEPRVTFPTESASPAATAAAIRWLIEE